MSIDFSKICIFRTDVSDCINLKHFSKSMPILWCNGGIWGIIDKAKVSNIIQLIEDAKSIPAVHTPPQFKIFWEEVVLVPKKLAEIIAKTPT